MKQSTIYFILVMLIASIITGCSGKQHDLQVTLGQEVILSIGHNVLVADEDLSIEFIDVTADSRCPEDVICEWQGQAICALRITSGEAVSDLNIIEPGLTDDYSDITFGKYKISFTLNPYPISTAAISKEDYRLTLICDLNDTPIETEPDFIGFITDIQSIGENGVIGRVSVESHADKIVSKYIVTIKEQTGIYRQAADKLTRVTFQMLENKQWVKLWFDGPILESFPMQATAGQVVIME